jgi:hypothetical protein
MPAIRVTPHDLRFYDALNEAAVYTYDILLNVNLLSFRRNTKTCFLNASTFSTTRWAQPKTQMKQYLLR